MITKQNSLNDKETSRFIIDSSSCHRRVGSCEFLNVGSVLHDMTRNANPDLKFTSKISTLLSFCLSLSLFCWNCLCAAAELSASGASTDTERRVLRDPEPTVFVLTRNSYNKTELLRGISYVLCWSWLKYLLCERYGWLCVLYAIEIRCLENC